MDSLKDWVRQLTLLVLVASCLELLLPMNSMKKYVRMAMGLLVVLAITRPLFGFLGQPVTIDGKLFVDPEGASLPALSEIMAQAKEFRDRNQDMATKAARTALEAEVIKAVREVAGVSDATAGVELVEVSGEQRIRNVVVTLRLGVPGEVQPVKPVEPVSNGQGPPAPTGPREPAEAEQKLAAAVRQAVGVRLGIAADPRLIQVLVAQ